MKRFEEGAALLPAHLYQRLYKIPEKQKAMATEIRLRSDRPVSVTLRCKNTFLVSGGLSDSPDGAEIVSACEMREIFKYLCEGSVYCYTEQIKEGYLALKGGHRAGVAGSAVFDNGLVRGIKYISSVNLRIARQIKGCGAEACRIISGNGVLRGALLLSPPAGGKTTILRDIARILSCGGRRVCVVDSRGEIAASCGGVPQNDLGPLCDVLDGYSKAAGILQAIRTLSPEAVICDEVGGMDECAAIVEGMNAGVPVIASAHAGSIGEALRRPQLKALLQSGAVARIICLAGPEEPGRIIDVKDSAAVKGLYAN